MKTVQVLLSTYNGEKFLRKQLDSIYSQEDISFSILVRDDGSQDNTLLILHEYKAKYGKMEILEGENVGPAMSFYLLQKNANKDYDYFAFSDQDDIWYPNKLKQAVACLEKSKDKYRYYYCNFDIIDSDGNIFSEGYMMPYANYKTVIFRNHCLGCSQVFNRSLLERSLDIFAFINSEEFSARDLMLHDVWMTNMAYYLDSYIYCDDQKRFGYRQHGGNVTHYTGKSKIKKFFDNFKTYKYVTPSPFSHAAMCLKNYEATFIEKGKNDFLDKVIHYKDNYFHTISFAFQYSWQFHKSLPMAMYTFLLIMARRF